MNTFYSRNIWSDQGASGTAHYLSPICVKGGKIVVQPIHLEKFLKQHCAVDFILLIFCKEQLTFYGTKITQRYLLDQFNHRAN